LADGSKTESDYDVLYRIMSTRMRRAPPEARPDFPMSTSTRSSKAGRWAMFGANGQPWEYLVIKDPKKKKALYDAFQDTNQEFCFWMEQIAAFRASPSRLPGQRRRSQGRMAENPQQHRRAAAPSLARGAGRDRSCSRTAAGSGRRLTPRSPFGRHASHFTDGLANTCTHMQLAIASLGLGSQLGDGARPGAAEARARVPDLITSI